MLIYIFSGIWDYYHLAFIYGMEIEYSFPNTIEMKHQIFIIDVNILENPEIIGTYTEKEIVMHFKSKF